METTNISKESFPEVNKEKDKKYYWEHFDEIMLEKIDKGELLTESEIRSLVWESEEVDRGYGENRRWTRSVTSIVNLCGRYFAIPWEEGLTECQENEYYYQPYEVEKKTSTKTITVTEWVPLRKDE